MFGCCKGVLFCFCCFVFVILGGGPKKTHTQRGRTMNDGSLRTECPFFLGQYVLAVHIRHKNRSMVSGEAWGPTRFPQKPGTDCADLPIRHASPGMGCCRARLVKAAAAARAARVAIAAAAVEPWHGFGLVSYISALDIGFAKERQT